MVLRLFPVAFAFAALIACASTSWKATRDADTADAYRAFLRDHPDDVNVDAARVLLSEREFEAASKQHTLLAYKRYLEEFPDSEKASAARARLEGMRFNAAKEQNTAQAWRLFLQDHPQGAHRAEAELALVEAEYREAAPGTDTQALAKLVKERPDDPRRLELQAKLDDETFAAARKTGAFALYQYLRDFPAGAHREQAQVELLALRVRALLASGLVARAEEELRRSPLTPKLEGVDGWVKAAQAQQAFAASRDPLVQAARPGHYLRSIADLERSLAAPDPLDRWQAAEELGQHVSVDAIDPLLNAFRTARNPLIRQRAFDSLRRLTRALPAHVTDYELATRIEAMRERSSSAETWLTLAVLLDLSGRLEQAALEYQRAWEPNLPDPVILSRWMEIRRERRQPFSAAVAARQLALWSERVARELELPQRQDRIAVGEVRELCAASINARAALETIRAAKAQTPEFPEDLAQFELTATDAVRLSDARLRDAELILRTQDPHARTCDDRRVTERISAGVRDRSEALRALAKKGGPSMLPALQAARDADPSAEVRTLATTLLTANGRAAVE